MCVYVYLKLNLKMMQDTNVCMCEIKLSFAGMLDYIVAMYVHTYVLYFRYVT